MRETWDLGRSNLQPHDEHDILKFRGPVRKESNNEVQKIRTIEILDLNIFCGQINENFMSPDWRIRYFSSKPPKQLCVCKLRLHIHAIQWPGHQLGPRPRSLQSSSLMAAAIKAQCHHRHGTRSSRHLGYRLKWRNPWTTTFNDP